MTLEAGNLLGSDDDQWGARTWDDAKAAYAGGIRLDVEVRVVLDAEGDLWVGGVNNTTLRDKGDGEVPQSRGKR